MRPIPNGFWDRDISLYSSKTVDKRYYVLFLISLFIVQVTKLVQFTEYNPFSKIPASTSMHFPTSVRTWRVARLYSVQSNTIGLSRKPFGIGHMHIYTFLLRMTDTMTSQNIDLSSWDTLYNSIYVCSCKSELNIHKTHCAEPQNVFPLNSILFCVEK
jgi:hypothetical protein